MADEQKKVTFVQVFAAGQHGTLCALGNDGVVYRYHEEWLRRNMPGGWYPVDMTIHSNRYIVPPYNPPPENSDPPRNLFSGKWL